MALPEPDIAGEALAAERLAAAFHAFLDALQDADAAGVDVKEAILGAMEARGLEVPLPLRMLL